MATGTSGIPVVTVRGALGNVVFQRLGDGLMVRERVVPHDPQTAAQLAARAAMAEIARRWAALSDAEFHAWEAFAATLPGGGGAYRAYLGLTARWLRLHGGGAPPSLPPAGPFFGDNVGLSASPSFRSGERKGPGDGEPETPCSPPPTPSSPGTSHPVKEGGVLALTASQPNAAGVVTEVLVQPLANARRKPRARDWKTAAFLTFAAGALTRTVPLAPGAYAVAYRFVNAATGQATATAPLGTVALG